MSELNPGNRNGTRGELRLLLAAPRGFCAGVTRAIDAVRDALAVHGAPVYVRRPIVHNREVMRALEAEGAIFVEELDEVPPGSVVIFSAHGSAPSVHADAKARGLIAYDAVCPLVSKVHREVRRHQDAGRAVILIGHEGHPEIEGSLGQMREGEPGFVISSPEAVDDLPLRSDTPTAYAVQTTYAVDEAERIVEALRARFPDLAEPPSSDICYATTNRQAAMRDIAKGADAVIVVGALFSSNAKRLAEVAAEDCPSVQLIGNRSELDWSLLPLNGVVAISAAASTPETSVQDIIAALRERYRLVVEERVTARETAVFRPVSINT